MIRLRDLDIFLKPLSRLLRTTEQGENMNICVTLESSLLASVEALIRGEQAWTPEQQAGRLFSPWLPVQLHGEL